MYTFAFIAKTDNEVTNFELQNCASITQKWMPSLGVKLVEHYQFFPEMRCGYFFLEPESSQNQSWLSEASNKRYATLVFGDVLEAGTHNPAQTILNVWQSGGVKGVRKLEGSFSAVIIDRIAGAITLLGDLIGQRSLRFYNNSDMIIISPHELPIVATGHCPIDLDPVSVASITAFEHSLGGHSILRHITSCHPTKYVRWSHGEIHHTVDSIFDYEQRIDPRSSKEIRENLEQMLDTANQYTKRLVADSSTVEMTLSAGADSRAVLACLLSVVDDPAQITAICSGESESIDIKVASKIAKLYGLGFRPVTPPPTDSSDFLAHCDLLAFSMNGDFNSKEVTRQSLPTFGTSQMPIFHGDGGEIFRGYYNQSNRSHRKITVADAFRMLRFSQKIKKPPLDSNEIVDMLLARIKSIMSDYSSLSSHGHDILNMFYLYERTAISRAAKKRQPWRQFDRYLFYGTKLIRHAYKMPVPIINYARFHDASIHRYSPEIYRLRINEKMLISLENGGVIRQFFNRLDQKVQGLRKQVSYIGNAPCYQYSQKDPNLLRAEAFSGPLREVVRDTILSNDSASMMIFDPSRLNLIVAQHESSEKDHSNMIGSLLTFERYYSMISNAFGEAKNMPLSLAL